MEPDYGHTKLRLSEQGLEAIRRIEIPIAIVGVSLDYYLEDLISFLNFHFEKKSQSTILCLLIVLLTQVIGPYRSGKSFLLHQLLSLSCDKGRCCLAPPSISHGFDEMHSRTNNKLINLMLQVLELVICGILKLKVTFFVAKSCSCSCIVHLLREVYKLMIIPVLLLQVYGFGVNLLRWMLMAPKYLSFILTQKDLRVLGSPMYTTIGLCSDVCYMCLFLIFF